MVQSDSEEFSFQDREDAGQHLVLRFKDRKLRSPIVLAIPRGGVVTGAALAKGLGAELDVVLARKLRAPFQPELALGAVGEDGEVYFDQKLFSEVGDEIEAETKYQLNEIDRRKKIFREVRPAAELQGRSVIVTDDGIATGSTMIAALHVIRNKNPYEVIVAVPVASPTRLNLIAKYCDEIICLISTENFHAVGQFYDDFSPVEDQETLRLLEIGYKSLQKKEVGK